MAIPRGRFLWDFNGKTAAEGQKIVQQWGGYCASGDSSNGMWVVYSNGTEVTVITLPEVIPNMGHIFTHMGNALTIGVTLGPDDMEAKWSHTTSRCYINPKDQNATLGATDTVWYGGMMSNWNTASPYINYQSWGPNMYSLNKNHGRDKKVLGTIEAIVAKGVQLSSGLPSCLILCAGGNHWDCPCSWTAFHFFIWDPIIESWVTGDIAGIRQTLRDDSHVIISPLEFNGFSFPGLYLADGDSNVAFGAYCSPYQLKYHPKSIKKVTLDGHSYNCLITGSQRTILLTTNSPDGLADY